MATLNKMTSMIAIMAITLVEVILLEVVEKGVMGAMAMWALVGLFTALVGACVARGEDHACVCAHLHIYIIHTYTLTYRHTCRHTCTFAYIHSWRVGEYILHAQAYVQAHIHAFKDSWCVRGGRRIMGTHTCVQGFLVCARR